MNIHIYKQASGPWASLPYPGRGYNFGPNGCGACSVLHCIIEMNRYKKWTPSNVQPYMKQFATYGNGTTWAGITTALKHYGLKDVSTVSTMSKLWPILKKGNHVGVLLFGSRRGPDGTLWTSGGHYIAYVNYKVKNGKHYFYLKDSGGRNHDGWWCYENSMRGTIYQVWVARLPKDSEIASKYKSSLKKTGYTGTLPTTKVSRKQGTKTEVKRWQKFLNWWYKFGLAVDGDFGNATEMATMDFQLAHGIEQKGVVGPKTRAAAKKYRITIQKKMTAWAKAIAKSEKYSYKFYDAKYGTQCPICHPHKGKNKGWNCIGFAFGVWHHGGGLNSTCNCGVIDNGTANKILAASDSNALKIARNKIGIKDIKVIRNNKKKIPLSQLKEGDIVQFFSGNQYYHTAYYMGDGKIADSNVGRKKDIKANVTLSDNAKNNIKVAYRYTGK